MPLYHKQASANYELVIVLVLLFFSISRNLVDRAKVDLINVL